MRGMPNTPVPCEICGAPGYPKDRRCLTHRASPRLKYPFDAQKDMIVREAWLNAGNRLKLNAAITDATRRIGYPRHIVRLRAQWLGLTFDLRHKWEPWEEEYLRNNCGEVTVKAMSRALKHGCAKIVAKISSMGLRRGIQRGMALRDVAIAFGVSQETAMKWEKAGLIKRCAGRFRDAAIRKFACEHPELYDLRRVDQDWYKAMLFPAAKCFLPLHPPRASAGRAA